MNTFNDLSEARLAPTWGKRYALGKRDAQFRFSNPYKAEEISDHFGKFARIEAELLEDLRVFVVVDLRWQFGEDLLRLSGGAMLL